MDANRPSEDPAEVKDKATSAAGATQWDTRFEQIKKLVLVKEEEVLSLEKLYLKESADLGKKVDMEKFRVSTGTGGEPWVHFTTQDRFGLALSGGGIRSATFNLGLLQSLDQLRVLEHLDYLATVSGGGYIGGFWTAWLRRNPPEKSGGKFFPVADDSTAGESAEVRHLREFSRFLLPRFRILGTEFWGIVMTVLGGLLPSLASALAVLVLMWSVWVLLLGLLHAEHNYAWHLLFMICIVGGEFIRSEFYWKKPLKSESNPSQSRWKQYADKHTLPDRQGYFFGAFAGCALTAFGWLTWHFGSHWPGSASGGNLNAIVSPAAALPGQIRTTDIESIFKGVESVNHLSWGFKPALVIGSVTLILLFIRALLARVLTTPAFLAGFERAVTRMLRLTVILLSLEALWFAACWIAEDAFGDASDGRLLHWTGAGTVFSTALFLWVRKWLSEPPTETHGDDLLKMAFGWLKRATPKVMAAITLVLLFMLVGVGIARWLQLGETDARFSFWWLPGVGLFLVGLMICGFDPERMGMHELYRSRISRCYLGASNKELNKGITAAARAAQNRSTSEHPGDDMPLADLDVPKVPTRPLHLVCTAANDLLGDPVGTLYRGAKSAVLSADGISVSGKTAKFELRFSSALTTSAAAFNSQMGRFSINLGPAVTFLMAAFNLRLGLWVPHPDTFSNWQLRLPGRFFFLELLGWSKADGRHLLLSDGGHFENFGLYELIRRHCRYIIVSDCGSDPESAYDDLANVIRRVREDFGVEVELDVRPLNLGATGLSSQHAVVGTIHYNGLGGMDKGTLLFMKPAITGDEPPDVLQYRTRNHAYPQESTVNQFYDEPQWESYRRLGEHTGRTVLEFLDRPDEKRPDTVDNIFREVRSFWYTLPDNLSAQFTEMSARCAELEQNLTTQGPLLLRQEFFPEVAELAKPAPPPEADGGAAQPPRPAADLTEELDVLGFLLQIVQLMEDVWVSANLERYWSHPLNEGWMNYFHRWAATPSFRHWWPVLAPIYSSGFRSFVKERFSVGVVDPAALPPGTLVSPRAILTLSQPGRPGDYQNSNAWRCFLQRRPDLISTLRGKKVFGYSLQLLNRDGVSHGSSLWVGFVVVKETTGKVPGVAMWRAEDFFVPPMLHGGTFVTNLLDAVIRHYHADHARHVTRLQVEFDNQPPRKAGAGARQKSQWLAPAERYDRVREIEFYKSRGFQYFEPEDHPKTDAISLYLDLHSTRHI